MNGYHATVSSGYLLVGFKEDSVSFIVKEIRNAKPLTKEEAERVYTALVPIGKQYGCGHFRIVAYGGYLPEALAFELHGLTISDAKYLKSLASGNHIELFPHNEAAYRAVEAGFRDHRIGAVVQATGTGKSFLIARYIATHATEQIVVIAPNITILNELRRAVGERAKRVVYRTFQALVRAKEEIGRIKADHILIDEFHHFGAEVWGEAVRELIENNPSARILGTSATPIRPQGMVDTVDVYFEGNLFYELTLPQAWYYGILPVPLLVQSVYGLDGELNKLQRCLDRSHCSEAHRKKIQGKLDAVRVDFKESLGATQLIKQFLPLSVRKLLVFCRDKKDLRLMIPEVSAWLEKAGFSIKVFEVHNDQKDSENERTLEAFRDYTGQLHVLFSINMLIEGLHVEGVDAALFLRRTESYVVTLQQLGRCLKVGSAQRPVILDFVNNLSGKSVYDVMSRDLERMSVIYSPQGFEGVTNFEVTGFISDIRQRVDEILAELEPWQVMFDRLQTYRTIEGDWPSVTEGKLGLWCNTQRIARKRGNLSEERVGCLEEIGFEWEQQDSRWNKNYEQLKIFHEKNNRWPKRGEGTLSIWCNTQRQRRKNGKLTKEHIRRLDAIGFIWSYDMDAEWLKMYKVLKQFHATKGEWPKTSESRLGAWCATQRKMFKQNLLSKERIELLENLDFTWSAEMAWIKQFEKLQTFYKSYGRWPTSREGSLGSWCFVQKRLYRKNQLSEERIKRLKSIGFLPEP